MATLVIYPISILCHQFDHQTFSFTMPRKLDFRGWQMFLLLRSYDGQWRSDSENEVAFLLLLRNTNKEMTPLGQFPRESTESVAEIPSAVVETLQTSSLYSPTVWKYNNHGSTCKKNLGDNLFISLFWNTSTEIFKFVYCRH